MTPEVANLAIQFMQRVQLTGQEVPAFNAVMRALQAVTAANTAQASEESAHGCEADRDDCEDAA